MYYARLLNLLNENFSLTSLGFASVGEFGSLALLLHNRGNAAVLSKLRSAFLAKAEKLAKVCDSNGWGVSLKPDQYNWGSNMTVLTNGMTFLIADYLEKRSINGDPHFRKYAAMQLDYILGVNATGYSYITGTGSLCVNYPHHRPAHADQGRGVHSRTGQRRREQPPRRQVRPGRLFRRELPREVLLGQYGVLLPQRSYNILELPGGFPAGGSDRINTGNL